ncbi:XdhC family protein [Parablastomonas sp. CN1-191]|uniref:XdhC family protein n=1 Tax=Parablastomonas sp. CN1-191 TaxID=3400908 RepID=UPI003BF86C40
MPTAQPAGSADLDRQALIAAAKGAALCTIVGIDGSFSRPVGAQLAIRADGSIAGSLSDGCLERQLASDSRSLGVAALRRYGTGSPVIDFRLPCGGGLDILIDPAPDVPACRAALLALEQRRPARLPLPANALLAERIYLPALAVRAFGEGPELAAFADIAAAAGIAVTAIDKSALALGQASGLAPADPWTAIVLLFHDHEWEIALLREALAEDAFYIGAQGGAQARRARIETLRAAGIDKDDLARVRSPIGTPPGSRSPQALALAVLAEITAAYEALRG